MEIGIPSGLSLGFVASGRKEEDIQRVASEMEALFLYQLLKVMKEGLGDNREDGLGKGVHQSLFDWELARELSHKRGLGLKDMIVRQLKGEYQKSLNISKNLPIKESGVKETDKGDLYL